MSKPLVLVVDDDDSVRRYLSSLLASIGYDVQCFPSGDKARGRPGRRGAFRPP